MTTPFPELSSARTTGAPFLRQYLHHVVRYPFHFFRYAPARKWWDFFGSTHRVCKACAMAECAIQNEPDIWGAHALRRRFVEWGEGRRAAK